jgi:hypothetical protein
VPRDYLTWQPLSLLIEGWRHLCLSWLVAVFLWTSLCMLVSGLRKESLVFSFVFLFFCIFLLYFWSSHDHVSSLLKL